MIDDYFLYNNIPELDLHGENRYSSTVYINEFIHNNYILRNRFIRIIHGKGTDTLRKTTFNILKNNKYVEDYKIDIFNGGATIILLKKKNFKFYFEVVNKK